MAAALPYIQAAGTIFGIGQGLGLWGQPKTSKASASAPAAVPGLSYEEALRQAGDVLNPLYDERLQQSLREVDRHNIARGFFGQLPGAALARSTAADIERARAGQIAGLAQQMIGQSQQAALQQQQLALQQAAQQSQARQGTFGNLLGAIGTGWNIYRGLADLTGYLPFTKQMTFPTQAEYASRGAQLFSGGAIPTSGYGFSGMQQQAMQRLTPGLSGTMTNPYVLR